MQNEEIKSVKQYVLGFLFDNYDRVLLVKKQRPAWQAGKLNGVGGKIELGETPLEAMHREFREETGLYLTRIWKEFATVRGPGWCITCFKCKSEEDLLDHNFSGIIDERPVAVPTHTLYFYPRIANLDWLLPLAQSDENTVASITYLDNEFEKA